MREWLTEQGYFVIPTNMIEDQGAPKLIEAMKATVLPDFQAGNANVLRWVEVKTKARTPYYKKLNRWQQGIEHWEDYLYIEETTRIPGYLAILELERKILFLGAFQEIKVGLQTYQGPNMPRPMTYFDIMRFKDWYDVSADGRVQSIERIPPQTVRPWEKNRKDFPNQLTLFNFDEPERPQFEH